jgi:ectoine hydroxylase-related dioxygenase (phytanoyl-CoA dioxygenase family)
LFRGLLFEHVSEFLYPVHGYQPLAAMRVNLHGSKAILRFHADSEYGQTAEGINLWLPVTSTRGTNSMYLESDVGRADFAPLQLEYGQACIFRGGALLHGTVDNDSGSTRISYDIRFRVKQP